MSIEKLGDQGPIELPPEEGAPDSQEPKSELTETAQKTASVSQAAFGSEGTSSSATVVPASSNKLSTPEEGSGVNVQSSVANVKQAQSAEDASSAESVETELDQQWKEVSPEEKTLYEKSFHEIAQQSYYQQELPPEAVWKDISARRKEIQALVRDWEAKLSESPQSEFTQKASRALKEGQLKPMKGGMTGTYKLLDRSGKILAVVKPVDEELLALNNPKGVCTPFTEKDGLHPKKGVDLRLYQTAQNGALAYETAQMLGVERITPKAELMIIENEAFHDICDDFEEKTAKQGPLADKLQYPGKKKLCLIQEFLPDTKELGTLVLEASGAQGKEDAEALDLTELKEHMKDDMNHDDFSLSTVFSLVIGECDGNAGNFLVSNSADPGTGQRRVWKIDNAVSFPRQNSDEVLSVGVEWSPHNGSRPLSKSGTELCNKLKSSELVDKLAERMRYYGKTKDEIAQTKLRIQTLTLFGTDAYKTDPSGKEYWDSIKSDWAEAWEISDIDNHQLNLEQIATLVYYYSSP